jgi:anthranilate/para-aminobenzoate synthase component II
MHFKHYKYNYTFKVVVNSSNSFFFRIVFSSSVTLFLPIMIETERMGIEEAQKQQQRQILLGPGSAMSAGANAPLPKMPA